MLCGMCVNISAYADDIVRSSCTFLESFADDVGFVQLQVV